MLAYAPARNVQPARPGLFALIVLGHAGLIGAVMAAKFVYERPNADPTDIVFIDPVKPPPPPPPPSKVEPSEPVKSTLSKPEPLVPLPPAPGPTTAPTSEVPVPSGPVAGTGQLPVPPVPPAAEMVRKGPVFATPADSIRPPYPVAMREREREAVLRLRLSIDAGGRVTAVESVGRADPVFLDAARRHILKAWRYRPATEDGRPVATSTVVTLKFELDRA